MLTNYNTDLNTNIMAKTTKPKSSILSLTLKERVLLPGILPTSGRKIEMILANDLLKRAEFTPQEVAEFGLKDLGNGRIVWDPRKEKDLELDLTKEQVELLKKASETLDNEGRVTRDTLPLLEKIDAL